MSKRSIGLRPLIFLALFSSVVLQAQAATPQNKEPAKVVNKRPVILTGEVDAIDSQSIFVPPSNSSPVVLRNFVAEGTAVKSGDLVLRIETQGAANIDQLHIEAEQVKARAEQEVADLEVKAVEAEKVLANAKAAYDKARVDAALPKSQISSLDYDRYQGENNRAERDLEVKQKAYANANDSVARRRSDGELEMKKLQINLLFSKALLTQSEVRAKQDGVVIHGYSNWRGERYEEGSSAFPGNSVGQVMGSGQMLVRAWVLEADRPFLSEGQAVRLGFDALPSLSMLARVSKIASAPEAHANWGSGRYFRIEITLPENHGAALIPGMSVIIEPQSDTLAASKNVPATSSEVNIEGEIASKISIPISPPTIQNTWQYTLAQLAPEGSIVEAGQSIAKFEAPDVSTKLDTNRSALKEKQRTLEKQILDHKEADKSGDLAVSEAKSNAEKAERKATMPKDLIRRIDYDKLVIEKILYTQLATLAVRQREAQGRARKAERSGLMSQIAKLENAISLLTKGQKALEVMAPRRGMLLYRTSFNGDKFAIGSQVWMGLSIATLADPEQLFVNAKVPEAQAASIKIGQIASIKVPGANLSLAAHVSGLGRVYHSKSASQPVIVRDIQLQFDSVPKGLKPGSTVQASLSTKAVATKDLANNKPSGSAGEQVSKK